MGVVLGGVVRIPLKLSFVIPSTYHLLLLLDKHWLLAPKPCQSCCSCGSKWAATTNFTPCLVVSNQRFFCGNLLSKVDFHVFLLGDLYRKESGNSPHNSDDENCRIYADSLKTWKHNWWCRHIYGRLVLSISSDYLSQFYFGVHSCKQVCSRRRENPSSTKALPSTLSDATGISLNLVGKKASLYIIHFFHGSEVRYAYTFTCIHRYAYLAILE